MRLSYWAASGLLLASSVAAAAAPSAKKQDKHAPSKVIVSTGGVSAVVPPAAPSWSRLSGKVTSLDRQEYKVDVSTQEGRSTSIMMTNEMAVYRGGHAVRWNALKSGDAVTILRHEQPVEVAAGTQGDGHASGSVEWVDRKEGTFRLKRSDGFSEDFLSGREARLSRGGTPVRYDALAPGDVVDVDYDDVYKGS
jgi:hypothetical protein